MSNQIKKIVEKLPEGLSENGLEEVASIIDEVVEERVSEEIKVLESKVKAFLRTKLDELKDTARRELEVDDTIIRSSKVFEAIKTLVASEIESADVESAVSFHEQHNEELTKEVDLLRTQLDEAVRAKGMVETKMEKQSSKLTKLSEALDDEREKVEMPFKSSESAIIISNESHGVKSLSENSVENFFLNEDVIRLSQLNLPSQKELL